MLERGVGRLLLHAALQRREVLWGQRLDALPEGPAGAGEGRAGVGERGGPGRAGREGGGHVGPARRTGQPRTPQPARHSQLQLAQDEVGHLVVFPTKAGAAPSGGGGGQGCAWRRRPARHAAKQQGGHLKAVGIGRDQCCVGRER